VAVSAPGLEKPRFLKSFEVFRFLKLFRFLRFLNLFLYENQTRKYDPKAKASHAWYALLLFTDYSIQIYTSITLTGYKA